MGNRVRSTRRTSQSYSLSLELLEDRQLLSWSALSHAAPAPQAFVGPVQAPAGSSTAAAVQSVTSAGNSAQPDATPDDGEYADSAVSVSGAAPSNFVGPLQTTSATSNPTSSYTSSAYSTNDYSYTYYKPSTAGQYYPTEQAATSMESAVPLDAKPPAPIADAPLLNRPAPPLIVAALPAAFFANKGAEPALIFASPRRAETPGADLIPTDSADAPFLLSNHLSTAFAMASETLSDPLVVSSISVAAPALPVPQLARILAGTAAFDLANLQGAVDQFFARLEGLAREVGSSADLTGWLLAGATATGVFEFVRTKYLNPRLGEDDDPLWAPYPVLLFVPPEDAT